MGQDRQAMPILILAGAVLAASSSAVLVQWTETSAVSLAFWRTLGGALVLAPGALRSDNKPTGRDWLLVTIAGTALGLHFATWLASLRLTSVAASVFLVSTAPIFVALFGLVGLAGGPRLKRWGWLAIGIAIAGTIIIAQAESQASASEISQNSLLGNGLALVGAATIAVYFLVGNRLRMQLSTAAYACRTYAVAAVGLLAFALVSGVDLIADDLKTWLVILGMILGPQLAGHTALNYLLGRLGALTVSLSLLAEPIGASLMVWLIFDQVPPSATWLGAIIVIGAVALHLVAGAEPAGGTASDLTDAG